MFRPTLRFIRKVVIPSWRDNAFSRLLYSTNRRPRSTMKVTLVSASVGLLVGAGYGSYTHYKVNVTKGHLPLEKEEYTFIKEAPDYQPHFKVVSDTDSSNLQLVLFQYRTCPFCCKVRAYLDARGLSYEIVEVDAVLRQAIKWSNYKKVPILLAKVDGGYQQLLDSSAIVSVLETYLKDKAVQLKEVLQYYPTAKYLNDDGKAAMEVTNKYFIMHNSPVGNEKIQKDEIEERQWRQWADSHLVHLLSPNVYRTPSEALETFKWFEEVAGWRQAFPVWECTLMVYGGAVAMYFIGKRLKKRHEIPDDVRDPLYVATNKWLKAVSTRGQYHGGAEPNLADVAIYGILSSIEGCQAFKDLRENTKIANWYDGVKYFIERRKGKVIPVLAET